METQTVYDRENGVEGEGVPVMDCEYVVNTNI